MSSLGFLWKIAKHNLCGYCSLHREFWSWNFLYLNRLLNQTGHRCCWIFFERCLSFSDDFSLVIFSHFLVILRSPKTCSQNIAFSNLFQAVPLSLLLLKHMIFILISRLAVILKGDLRFGKKKIKNLIDARKKEKNKI